MTGLPARCRKCGLNLMDSLDIAVHIGRLGPRPFRKSLIYPYSKRCSMGATKRDIG